MKCHACFVRCPPVATPTDMSAHLSKPVVTSYHCNASKLLISLLTLFVVSCCMDQPASWVLNYWQVSFIQCVCLTKTFHLLISPTAFFLLCVQYSPSSICFLVTFKQVMAAQPKIAECSVVVVLCSSNYLSRVSSEGQHTPLNQSFLILVCKHSMHNVLVRIY